MAEYPITFPPTLVLYTLIYKGSAEKSMRGRPCFLPKKETFPKNVPGSELDKMSGMIRSCIFYRHSNVFWFFTFEGEGAVYFHFTVLKAKELYIHYSLLWGHHCSFKGKEIVGGVAVVLLWRFERKGIVWGRNCIFIVQFGGGMTRPTFGYVWSIVMLVLQNTCFGT